MAETFTRWDAADHLRNAEDVRLYLEACAEEDPGDGSLIRAALNDIARAQNMSRLAREIGMTREGLYKALSENGNPSLRHGHAHHPRVGHAGANHGLAKPHALHATPNLAEAMRALGYVQRFGVGIATARRALAENGNPGTGVRGLERVRRSDRSDTAVTERSYGWAR